jgi:hypothetical protein
MNCIFPIYFKTSKFLFRKIKPWLIIKHDNVSSLNRTTMKNLSAILAFVLFILFSVGGSNASAANETTKDLANVKNSYESKLVKGGGSITTDVTGTLANGLPVAGTYTITGFKVIKGVLNAVGTLNIVGFDSFSNVAIPVTDMNGTCDILTLDLGPVHLDLLGLVVDLNAIHLTITAEQGSGNLLGNLLCAVAGLLDGSGTLTQIAGLLNQILALLGNITL